MFRQSLMIALLAGGAAACADAGSAGGPRLVNVGGSQEVARTASGTIVGGSSNTTEGQLHLVNISGSQEVERELPRSILTTAVAGTIGTVAEAPTHQRTWLGNVNGDVVGTEQPDPRRQRRDRAGS